MERNHNTVKPRRFPVLRFAILQPVRTEHARLVRRIHGDRGGALSFLRPTVASFSCAVVKHDNICFER